MSLSNPENEKEAYIQKVRLHMEQLFGQELISSLCEFTCPKETGGDETIDSIMFQPYSLVSLPEKKTAKIHLFIHPGNKEPFFALIGKHNMVLPLTGIPIEEIEASFASIINGAQVTDKGVKLPPDLKNPVIH